eukprot:scaffold177_cov334-Pavlova_lutheri.AAC.23
MSEQHPSGLPGLRIGRTFHPSPWRNPCIDQSYPRRRVLRACPGMEGVPLTDAIRRKRRAWKPQHGDRAPERSRHRTHLRAQGAPCQDLQEEWCTRGGRARSRREEGASRVRGKRAGNDT